MSVIHMGHGLGGHLSQDLWHEKLHHFSVTSAHLAEMLVAGTLAASGAVCAWVAISLATGFLNLFMVMLVGVATGFAVKGCSRQGLHDYRLPAVAITVLGSIIGNVMAGLTLFSSRMGVEYRHVLTSQRMPEDLPTLATTFAKSVEPDHLFFYAAAIYLAYLIAGRKHSRP